MNLNLRWLGFRMKFAWHISHKQSDDWNSNQENRVVLVVQRNFEFLDVWECKFQTKMILRKSHENFWNVSNTE